MLKRGLPDTLKFYRNIQNSPIRGRSSGQRCDQYRPPLKLRDADMTSHLWVFAQPICQEYYLAYGSGLRPVNQVGSCMRGATLQRLPLVENFGRI